MIIQMIVLLCLHFSYFLCAYHNDEPTFHVHGTIGRDIDTLHNDATHNSEPNSLVHVVQSNTRPMSQSEYNQLCKQAVEFDAYCKMTYGMNARSLEHCMYQKPEAFIADLLSRDYLPDVAVLELLAMYKYRHGYAGKKEHKIAHLVKKVQQELQNREKQRLAAYTVQPQQLVQSQKSIQPTQQESAQKQAHNIKSLEQKYSSSMLCHSSYGSSYHNDRQHALQHTQAQSYAKTEQTHELDAQTAGMLEAHGIDSKKFQSLSGTVFQHQLFKECADHYKKAAIAVFEHGLKNSGIVAHVIEITNVAFASTQQEACAWAVTLSDIAEVLADTSLSLCKGLIESGCSTIEIMSNPKQLLGALTRGMQFLGGAITAYDQQSTVGVVQLQACQQAFADDVVLFNQMCDLSKKHFIEWYQTSSEQEQIQEIAKLVADFTITPWLVGKTIKAMGGILCEAQGLVKFGRIVDLAEELGLGFEQAQELLYATQEGLQQVPTTVAEVETAVTSLIEGEGYKTIRPLNSNIQLSETEALLERKVIVDTIEMVMENDIQEIKALSTIERHITLDLEGIPHNMILDIEHFFIPEIIFRWDYNSILNVRFCKEFSLAGWHHKYLKEFEKLNLIKIVNKVIKNDCVYVEFLLPYGKTLIKKTLYPDHWPKKNIVEVIKKAISNPYRIELKGDAFKTLYSKLDNGIEMISYIKRESIDQTWHAKSSFISKDWILK